jgi:hypothetical protein
MIRAPVSAMEIDYVVRLRRCCRQAEATPRSQEGGAISLELSREFAW